MFGFLLQSPTLVTLVMFPILVVTYGRLARREERDVQAQFGTTWDAYASHTPAFIPRFGGTTREHAERRT
jgi:protein-S-isoprenylcysteine O-methyltransferase Ste14